MAKKGSKNNPVTIKELEAIANGPLRSFSIIEATIKDQFCNYVYEVTEGVGIGDKHTVKGSGIVKDDLMDAFAKFNVHLAVIDEAFKLSGIEITDIDSMHTDSIVIDMCYQVTKFVIKNSKGYDTIKLTGTKYVSSAGGWMDITTHEIPLDQLGSYKWYNELKAAADHAREEVALYKEGKYTPVKKEEDEETDKKEQGSLFDNGGEETEVDAQLESAEV